MSIFQVDHFERKRLNLVVVLDISGSMSSPFTSGEDRNKPKLEVAKETLIALLSHLNKEDNFGIVLFDDQASVLHPLQPFPDGEKLERLKQTVMKVQTKGCTNMEAGYNLAVDCLRSVAQSSDPNVYENRIIFLTGNTRFQHDFLTIHVDDQPNVGVTDAHGLLHLTQNAATLGIYSTFIGIGLDFNASIVEKITKVKGGNYYSVHTAKEFKQRLDLEFKYLVTPLVFNLGKLCPSHPLTNRRTEHEIISIRN